MEEAENPYRRFDTLCHAVLFVDFISCRRKESHDALHSKNMKISVWSLSAGEDRREEGDVWCQCHSGTFLHFHTFRYLIRACQPVLTFNKHFSFQSSLVSRSVNVFKVEKVKMFGVEGPSWGKEGRPFSVPQESVHAPPSQPLALWPWHPRLAPSHDGRVAVELGSKWLMHWVILFRYYLGIK